MGSLFPVKIRKEKSVSMNAKRRNRMKKKNTFNVKEIIETHRTPKTPKQYDTLFEKNTYTNTL